jgi:carboxymethylenebutenolidase
MSQTTIEMTTARGTMPVHVHRAARDKLAPIVVLYMDGPGIRFALHDHAERLARAGYTALLPDLFYAIDPADRPNVERLKARDPQEFERMGKVVARVHDDDVLEDTRLLLDTFPAGTDRAWACVGFCMGGRFGLRAAETFGNEVAAASLLHPSRLVTDEPDSPHLGVDRIGGALYLGYGGNDHVTPPSTIPPLRERLEQHGIAHRIEVMPGAEHGYTMPGMPAYNRDAAERAWAGTLELLDERL